MSLKMAEQSNDEEPPVQPEHLNREKLVPKHDLKSAESRYNVIAEMVEHMNHSNIERREIEIMEVLKEGEIQFPDEQPSIVMKLIENAGQYPECPPYLNIFKALLPSYQKSSLPGNEQPFSWLVKKFENIQIWQRISNMEGITTILQMLLPCATEDITKHLCSLVIHWIMRGSAFTPKFIDIFLYLIKNGADPACTKQMDQMNTMHMFHNSTKGGMDYQGSRDHYLELGVPERISASNLYARVIYMQISLQPELKSRLLDLLDLMLTEEAVNCSNVDRIGQNILHAMLIGITEFRNWKVTDMEKKKSLLIRIIKKNPDLCNGRDLQGRTPLCHFVQFCPWRFSLSKKLLSMNSENTATVQEMFTFMVEIVSVLAPHTDVDLQRKDGSTALHMLFSSMGVYDYNQIANQGYCKDLNYIVSKLLTKKNVNLLNEDDDTPYSWVMLWQDGLDFSESHQGMNDPLDNTACTDTNYQEDSMVLYGDQASTFKTDHNNQGKNSAGCDESQASHDDIGERQKDSNNRANHDLNDNIAGAANEDMMDTVKEERSCLESDQKVYESIEENDEKHEACTNTSILDYEDTKSKKNSKKHLAVFELFQELHTLFLQKNSDTDNSSSGLRFQRGLLIADVLACANWTGEGLSKTLRKVTKLTKRGYPECLKHPVLLRNIESHLAYLDCHLKLLDDQLRYISQSILETLIDESNSQQLYDIMIKRICKFEKENYFELFRLTSLCMDKGASPKLEDITHAQILILHSETSEELLASLKFNVNLVKAYRKNGNSENTFCYMNPLQNQYIISKAIRETAENAVLNSYGTMEECAISGSLINILLYMQTGSTDIQGLGKYFRLLKQLNEEESSVPLEMDLSENKFYKLSLGAHNTNWFQRGLLHLAAIYCHDKNVLNSVPKDIIEEDLHKKDLHGCTPLHIAYLHHNEAAIEFLVSNGAREDEVDFFGNSPKSLSCHAEVLGEDMGKGQLHETEYQQNCSTVMTVSSGVFETLKPMLLMPDPERDTIAEQMVLLFSVLVPDVKKVQCGGSVREKLKVGQLDEVDLQIFLGDDSVFADPANCLVLQDQLISRLTKVPWCGICLRPLSMIHPWQFMWEGHGSCRHLVISVDVVPIKVDVSNKARMTRNNITHEEAEKAVQPENTGTSQGKEAHGHNQEKEHDQEKEENKENEVEKEEEDQEKEKGQDGEQEEQEQERESQEQDLEQEDHDQETEEGQVQFLKQEGHGPEQEEDHRKDLEQGEHEQEKEGDQGQDSEHGNHGQEKEEDQGQNLEQEEQESAKEDGQEKDLEQERHEQEKGEGLGQDLEQTKHGQEKGEGLGQDPEQKEHEQEKGEGLGQDPEQKEHEKGKEDGHRQNIFFLKWRKIGGTLDLFEETDFKDEWEFLDSIPVTHRLGILFTKALLMALKNTEKNYNCSYLKMPITSYTVKLTLFGILLGRYTQHTQFLEQMEREGTNIRFGQGVHFDKDVRSKLEDWRLKSKLVFNPNPPDWFTEEEINEHAEDGRLWAERIIITIREFVKQSRLPSGFIGISYEESLDLSVNAKHLIQICERLLERLKPDVFFG